MPVCIIRPLKISHILPTTPYTWNRHSINICQAGRPPCSSPSKTPKKPSALGGIPAKITTYYFQLPIISTSTFLSTADIFYHYKFHKIFFTYLVMVFNLPSNIYIPLIDILASFSFMAD